VSIFDRRGIQDAGAAQVLALAFAIAFWAYYWTVHCALGPLQGDQLYFCHIFWMLRQGLRQYTDFYSYHLPLYFQLLLPLLPRGGGLSFIWWLRSTALIPLFSFALITNWRLWPFALMFLIFGRMTEIRPDTFGLLLFNLAWWLLLRRRSIPVAAALAEAALLFSARAAVMAVPFGLLCLYLARNDRRTMLKLWLIAFAFIASLAAVYLVEPTHFLTIVRAVYFDTSEMFHMGLFERFAEFERIVLVAMISGALIAAGLRLREEPGNVGALIIIVATISQIMLLFVDPAPYGYVFGWSMIPTVEGLALLPTAALAACAGGSAAALLALSVTYPAWRGELPAPGRPSHLIMDPPLGPVSSWNSPRLLRAMLSRQEIWNEIKIREEVCHRFHTVASYFWYQPVCIRDTYFDWIGLTWTAETFRKPPYPELVVWGEKPFPITSLKGYDIYPGFAIKRKPLPTPPKRTLGSNG